LPLPALCDERIEVTLFKHHPWSLAAATHVDVAKLAIVNQVAALLDRYVQRLGGFSGCHQHTFTPQI
jgi:hypothetical protein